ncbi:hypothetical protein PVAP13_9KG383400 [Panicum virgatum]|uniref:Uncharacterized protein n=1 Tax=Panicum virgatum TaxID=38727 RepID=A0A8T0NVP7_PANVG|nr:hypothetical protein PVAP13_9KG383400 [Panicum virgatum]
MQQSPSVTAPGVPVAIDMTNVQQLLEEMPLWSVHFQISWNGFTTGSSDPDDSGHKRMGFKH